ncbi:MAG: hypothetical protein CVU42_13375 [Chloroflexi bacterium HGW-Chloroflexi-4]|jgi:uncharacterized damage-inducible protein DinB|nr:MAG: hypothetical protein CVU42_13375 [Chloroflexi bacterium HGW-Chloroflexi-4]
MENLNKSALLVLHKYNSYANNLVLQTAAEMDETAFTGQSSPSHGSVQALLTHMLTTEFFFLARSEGKPVNPKSAPDKTLSLPEITAAFNQIADERLKYLNWVSEEKLLEIIDIPIGGQPFKLARWQLLTQSLLHSAHHRGELSIVMTGLGHPLPTLDAIIEFIHESGQNWPW